MSMDGSDNIDRASYLHEPRGLVVNQSPAEFEFSPYSPVSIRCTD